MKPLYLSAGGHAVAAIFEPAAEPAKSTAVLIVPPFGWDDQTSYRPRRDWSVALAAAGYPCLRIDLPGTGDSSGDARDDGLVTAWIEAVARGIEALRERGKSRVAVIALGAGGLVTLGSIASGAKVDDLVIWGMPANGRTFVREFKAFGRLEQTQTGEPSADIPDGELRAGGHALTASTLADLSALDPALMLQAGHPQRALVMGRDGSGPNAALVDELRACGTDVSVDPGRGWGAALARPQSTSPTALFDTVNGWLGEAAEGASPGIEFSGADSVEIGEPGSRVREASVVFGGAGQQLYAVVAEPLDAAPIPLTLVLYNAGAIRRIGPSRMWTEAARRWAAAGVSVLRVDIEGIGDAAGDGSIYRESDDPFYRPHLIDQGRAALDLAVRCGLPDSFVLGGLCSGGYWAFQAALADPRVRSVVLLNPRLLFFDPRSESQRELRKLRRLLSPAGLRSADLHKLTFKRAARLGSQLMRPKERCNDSIANALQALSDRGQQVAMAFSGKEPLHEELRAQLTPNEFERLNVGELPYKSHTLKPLKAQQAGHAFLDEAMRQAIEGCSNEENPPCVIRAQSTASRLS